MSLKLYWLDVETTGLFAGRPFAQILEIAVAEAELSAPFELKHIYHEVFRPPPDVEATWAHMDSYVQDMHTKNGLWAECLKAKRWVDEKDLLSLIPEALAHEDQPVLAGSSVHFDHTWLKYHMPNVAARFSHRYYDVSAIKLFCRSQGMEKIPRAEAHRAKADIEESARHG